MSLQLAAQRIVSHLNQIIQMAQHTTAGLAQDISTILRTSKTTRLNQEQAEALKSKVFYRLSLDPWAQGAGFADYQAPPSMVEDEFWLLKWWIREKGVIVAQEIELNQNAAQFFDFTERDWFQKPKTAHVTYIEGPYIDFLCNRSFALTVASPVLVGEQFRGVAAADLLVSTIETELRDALIQLECPAIIVNYRGRVLTSTAPRIRPGMLWKPSTEVAAVFRAVLPFQLVLLKEK